METAVSAGARPRPVAWSARAEPALSWLLGLLLVTLVAGNEGGFRATTWAWTAMVTWWLVVLALIVKRRVALGPLDLLFAGGALAFGGWFALSAVWSRSAPSTLDEVVRYLAYAGIVAAALLLTERRAVPHLVGGVTSGMTVLMLYALGTRVLPDRLGEFDTFETQYRLAAPITYWNGLGIFCTVGLLVAGGLAMRGAHLATRALAGATLPLFAVTMTFTFSRGAWLALPVGFLAALAVDPKRLQLTFSTGVLGVPPAVAVVLAADSEALTLQGATLQAAVDDGHRLVALLAALAAASAVLAVCLGLAERRIHVPRMLRAAWIGALVAAAVVAVGVVWAKGGSPAHIAREAWADAKQAIPTRSAPNTERLFNLSANGRFELWRVAWDGFRDEPLGGSGGGTYWQLWAASPRQSFSTVEAHNVYAETLAELGVVGLVLLAALLVAPLVGAVRARRTPLVPLVLGGYAAWLAHAGVDWDWELLGVTGAALLCGAALVTAARGERPTWSSWSRAAAGTCAAVLALFAVSSVVANNRLDAANEALVEDRPADAVSDADRARTFAPWSIDALEAIAAARQAQDRKADALATYRRMVERDPRNWIAWAEIASLATGAERAAAVAQVRQLNTRAPQLKGNAPP
jgi:hypothetical protein